MINMEIEARFHGRGGQGAVTAVQLLASAAIAEGRYAQAFPEFGPERRGAPVRAYLRISDRYIFRRDPVREPLAVAVLDPSLILVEDVLAGLRGGGIVVVNTRSGEVAARVKDSRPDVDVYAVDAEAIAMEVLGRPVVNTAVLGAFVRATGMVAPGSVRRAIEEVFPAQLAERNWKAVAMAMEAVKRA